MLSITVEPGYENRRAIRICREVLKKLDRELIPQLAKSKAPLIMEWEIHDLEGYAFAAFMRPIRRWYERGETLKFLIDPASLIEADEEELKALEVLARKNSSDFVSIPAEEKSKGIRFALEATAAHEVCHAVEFVLGMRSSERRAEKFCEEWAKTGKVWRFWAR